MRITLALVVMAGVAQAGNRVIVMGAPDDTPPALQLALANRSVEVATRPPPEGNARLDRAASAQRAAAEAGADASVWIEGAGAAAEVYVVPADGRDLRHAPLPPNASARTFATIATSLLDELVEPAPPLAIDVHVGVTDAGVRTTAAVAQPTDSWRHLVEIGPTISTATYGIEGELAFAVVPHIRLGVAGGVNQIFDGFFDYMKGTRLYDVGGEVRYVGSGARHFDVGLVGGAMVGSIGTLFHDGQYNAMEQYTAGFAALRFAGVREYDHGGIELALEPMLVFAAANITRPAIMASVRCDVPL